MKRLLMATAAVALLATSPALADCGDGEMVIKFAHVVTATGHPKGEFAEDLAKAVNEEMDGTACMVVFPNSQLYDDDKVMEAMLLGDVQLAAPSLSKFEAYTKKYRIWDFPFLFPNMEAVDAFAKSPKGQELLDSIQDSGFQGLGYLFNGLKQFSANRPLNEPSDAAGLKYRIQTSDVAEAMIEALGGTAQKLAFNEVYGALQTGVVDGQENSWSNIYTQKFFEVQDGITETNHQMLTYLMVAPSEWLDGLEPEVRETFLGIVEREVDAANAKATAINDEAKAKIIEAGSVVRELTDEQRQAWVDIMRPVWDQFIEDVGQDTVDAALEAGKQGS